MSTRCQVQVIESQEGEEYKITLYHHTNGEPSYMIPIIKKAYEMSGKQWESERAGKAASFLCAAEPGVFEPEEGHHLRYDIEYYYRIHLESIWQVEIFEPNEGFGDNSDEEHLVPHTPKKALNDFTEEEFKYPSEAAFYEIGKVLSNPLPTIQYLERLGEYLKHGEIARQKLIEYLKATNPAAALDLWIEQQKDQAT